MKQQLGATSGRDAAAAGQRRSTSCTAVVVAVMAVSTAVGFLWVAMTAVRAAAHPVGVAVARLAPPIGQPRDQPPTAPGEAAGAAERPSQTSDAYAYDPDGRRDPFVSLLTGSAGLRPPTERPVGLPGLSINEISLRGLVLTGGVYLAVMEAPDNKTYILRGAEQLFDGIVASVSSEGITFVQEVNDPSSLVTEREVLRTLGGREEGR